VGGQKAGCRGMEEEQGRGSDWGRGLAQGRGWGHGSGRDTQSWDSASSLENRGDQREREFWYLAVKVWLTLRGHVLGPCMAGGPLAVGGHGVGPCGHWRYAVHQGGRFGPAAGTCGPSEDL